MLRSCIRMAATVGLAALGFTGCDSSTGNNDERITLTLSESAVSLGQGQSFNVTVSIERTNHEKPVTLAIQGNLPNGVTAEFGQSRLDCPHELLRSIGKVPPGEPQHRPSRGDEPVLPGAVALKSLR